MIEKHQVWEMLLSKVSIWAELGQQSVSPTGEMEVHRERPNEEQRRQILQILAKNQLHILTGGSYCTKDLLPQRIGKLCTICVSTCNTNCC